MPDDRTIRTYDEKAAEYATLTGTDAPDQDLRAFIDLLPKGGRVLDLGCGPATASAHMRAAGLDSDPVDASEGMVALANETHQIGARLGTFDDINQDAVYDGIWANFSLLHAPRAALPRHLDAVALALKPGGIFHIGMKTGEGQERDRIDRLYTYVTVAELKSLLESAGLSVIAEREGVDKGLSGDDAAFVILRARKETDA